MGFWKLESVFPLAMALDNPKRRFGFPIGYGAIPGCPSQSNRAIFVSPLFC